MDTKGIAGGLVTVGDTALRQGLIEHARKRLEAAEEDHKWLTSKIRPQNRKLADGHKEALDTAQKVLALLNTDLPADDFVAIHSILMDSMDRVAKAFGGALGWQGGKARTGKSGGKGKVEQNLVAAAKAAAKSAVKEWWGRWQRSEITYQSKAEFARAMLDKYQNQLTSQPVIEGWCRLWEKEKP